MKIFHIHYLVFNLFAWIYYLIFHIELIRIQLTTSHGYNVWTEVILDKIVVLLKFVDLIKMIFTQSLFLNR